MNAKQLLKLLVIFGASLGLSYLLLRATAGTVIVVFDELLSAFLVVATLLVTMSVALYNYTDNITKDLSDVRNDVDREKLGIVLDKLAALKREVLLNGGLIAFLFVFERVLKGIQMYLLAQLPMEHHRVIADVSTALRVAFFFVSLVAAVIQLKGFLLAADFREHIVRNRR